MSDLISIVIPTYNRGNLVQLTINSALNQTYKNIEVIVNDNCSSDQTVESLKVFKNDNRFKFYRNHERLSIVNNWYETLSYATGKYTLILWSDDKIYPTFIERTHSVLSKEENSAFVFVKTLLFNEKKIIKSAFNFGESGKYTSKEFNIASILGSPLSVPVSPANTLFRTEDLKSSLNKEIENKFNIKYSEIGQGNDALIFLNILKKYNYFNYLDEELALFRFHKESITIKTNSLLVNLRYLIAKSTVVNTMSLDLEVSKKFHSRFFLLASLYFIFGGRYYSYKNLVSYSEESEIKLRYILTSLFNLIKSKYEDTWFTFKRILFRNL